MNKILFLLLFSIVLNAKVITPNDVYSLSVKIQDHIHFLLKYYGIEHHHEEIVRKNLITSTDIKPRHTWQKSYELLVKINTLRKAHKLPRIEPVGVEALQNMKPAMVYEMNLRILTELKIFEFSQDIEVPNFKSQVFSKKMPIDNYNILMHISASLDELNKKVLTPSYVFAEVMRVYEDLASILYRLNIRDVTIPDKIMSKALPQDNMLLAFEILDVIASLQGSAGIQSTDLSEFRKDKARPSEVFTLIGLIISEVQSIKAYIGLEKSITPAAKTYTRKKPRNVEQLMRWNLKKIKLIKKLQRR